MVAPVGRADVRLRRGCDRRLAHRLAAEPANRGARGPCRTCVGVGCDWRLDPLAAEPANRGAVAVLDGALAQAAIGAFTDWPQSRPIGGACGPCRTCVGVGCDWRLATDWPQSRPIGGACGPCRTCVGVGCDWRSGAPTGRRAGQSVGTCGPCRTCVGVGCDWRRPPTGRRAGQSVAPVGRCRTCVGVGCDWRRPPTGRRAGQSVAPVGRVGRALAWAAIDALRTDWPQSRPIGGTCFRTPTRGAGGAARAGSMPPDRCRRAGWRCPPRSRRWSPRPASLQRSHHEEAVERLLVRRPERDMSL